MIASRNLERLSNSAEEIRSQISTTNKSAQLDHMKCNIRKEEDVSVFFKY